MKFSYPILTLAVLSLSFGSCKSPEEKLQQTEKKESHDVAKAQQKVAEVRQDQAKKIEDAQGAPDVEAAKIKATEKIAEAKKKVEDEKIDQTKKVADAEQAAKKDTNPEVP